MDKRYLLALLTQGPTPWIVAGIWGAMWGSFYNVVIARVPAGESVVRPASHCRSCKAELRWFDNIPILSYLLLRGRCRRCGARYSPRYLLVELVVALIALAVFKVTVIDGAGAPGLRLARFAILSLFGGLLVAISMIDIDTMLIPNVITYPAIPLCAVLAIWMGLPRWYDGAIGAAAGYLTIRLLADGYRLVTGRTGMGYGDAKLLAMIGGLLGWQVLLPVLFLSSMQGSLVGIPLLIIARRRAAASEGEDEGEDKDQVEDQDQDQDQDDADVDALRYSRIPFGPYIALAGLELMLLRETIMAFFPYLR
ncbi:MAG: prepilin peptidase [Myxococcales bacterium]|nr:prepilin peptidase [Myxococcales bacterium]